MYVLALRNGAFHKSLSLRLHPNEDEEHNQLNSLSKEKILSLNCKSLKYCAEQNYKIRITQSAHIFLYLLVYFKGQSSEFQS